MDQKREKVQRVSMWTMIMNQMMTLIPLKNYWEEGYQEEKENTKVNFLLSILHVEKLVILLYLICSDRDAKEERKDKKCEGRIDD